MDYIKIRFGSEFDGLDPMFESTVEEMFRHLKPMFRLSEQSWKPQMDIYETQTEIIVLGELAGVKKEDLEIEISSKAVKIQGFRTQFPKMENTTYRLAEIQYGRFERILYLPSPIDTEKATASCKDGFLKIHLVKLPKDRVHKIAIFDEE